MELKIKINEYNKICEEYNLNWKLLDQQLYRICSEIPNHSTKEKINAKLWIISRTYMTGIERQIDLNGQENEQGKALQMLARLFEKNKNKIDNLISEIHEFVEPLNENNLKIIIKKHYEFCNILNEIMRENNNMKKLIPRSFCSKYLHFHCPVVPIYDNVAVGNINRIIDRRKMSVLSINVEGDEGDDYYIDYCSRFLKLYDWILNHEKDKKEITVKLLDNYLIEIEQVRPNTCGAQVTASTLVPAHP